MKNLTLSKLLAPHVLLAVFLLVTTAVSYQQIAAGGKTYGPGGPIYTHYNNYVIFKSAFFHLLEGKDLYQSYPAEQFDLYKYSPTFALAMAPLALLSDAAGLFLWNLLNVFLIFFGIYRLPQLDIRQKSLILWTCLIELITSLQNSQSNGMMAGLIVLSFVCLERRNYLLATFLVVGSAYIKVFGILSSVLFLFFPEKRRLIGYSVFWACLLGALPLMAVDGASLSALYKSWFNLMATDHSASYGLSVMGWLHSWFGLSLDKGALVLAGAVIFLLPFLRFSQYKDDVFRLLNLASVLIWVVIFNHKAESPTFIIAMVGVAIWYFAQPRSRGNLILLVLALVFTTISPTDGFPASVRNNWVVPYVLKAVPCILIWGKLIYDLMALPVGHRRPPPISVHPTKTLRTGV